MRRKTSEYYCPITGPNASADFWISSDLDNRHIQYLHIFYEDWKFKDYEITLTINLN